MRHRFWQKIVIHTPILLSIKISIPEVFWNTEGSPYYLFQNCETKTLTKNCETTLSSLIHKNFDTRSFLKHRLVPLRNFWTLWDKKLLGENSYIPFLCVNFFHGRLFLKRRRILLWVFLVLWDKKTDTNLWNNPSSLIHWKFWYQNFFWNTERSFYEMFRYG